MPDNDIDDAEFECPCPGTWSGVVRPLPFDAFKSMLGLAEPITLELSVLILLAWNELLLELAPLGHPLFKLIDDLEAGDGEFDRPNEMDIFDRLG